MIQKACFLIILIISPLRVFGQEHNEMLKKIEDEYGEQWSFCKCVLVQDSLNKAIMQPDLTDEQFDSLFVVMDNAEQHCVAFLATTDMKDPDARARHEEKVIECLKNNLLSMEERYVPITADHYGQLEKIATIDISIPKITAEFYVRLYSLLGVEPVVQYEGYEFFIQDKKTQTKFTLALTGFGIGYWTDNTSSETQAVINEFHEYLFNVFDDLKDCQTEFEHDYGKTIIGYKDGKIFEEHQYEK